MSGGETTSREQDLALAIEREPASAAPRLELARILADRAQHELAAKYLEPVESSPERDALLARVKKIAREDPAAHKDAAPGCLRSLAATSLGLAAVVLLAALTLVGGALIPELERIRLAARLKKVMETGSASERLDAAERFDRIAVLSAVDLAKAFDVRALDERQGLRALALFQSHIDSETAGRVVEALESKSVAVRTQAAEILARSDTDLVFSLAPALDKRIVERAREDRLVSLAILRGFRHVMGKGMFQFDIIIDASSSEDAELRHAALGAAGQAVGSGNVSDERLERIVKQAIVSTDQADREAVRSGYDFVPPDLAATLLAELRARAAQRPLRQGEVEKEARRFLLLTLPELEDLAVREGDLSVANVLNRAIELKKKARK